VIVMCPLECQMSIILNIRSDVFDQVCDFILNMHFHLFNGKIYMLAMREGNGGKRKKKKIMSELTTL